MSGGDGIPCGVRCARPVRVLVAIVVVGTSTGVLWRLLPPRARTESDRFGHITDIASAGLTSAEELEAAAIAAADRLVERFPRSPDALTLAGSTYYALGRKDEADRRWEEALKVDSACASALQVMGEAAWEHGDYESAIRHMQRAIQANPGLLPELAFYLADSLMNVGCADEAIDTLERSALLEPLSSDGLFLLGYAYLQTGQYSKSQGLLESALVVDNDSTKIHFALTSVYQHLGNEQKSRLHRAEYVRLMERKLDETTRGRSALRQKNLGDVRPLAGRCFLNAGKIYALHGDVENAETHWLRAMAAEPYAPEPRRWLALLYSEQGRSDDARRVLQQAAAVPPGDQGG